MSKIFSRRNDWILYVLLVVVAVAVVIFLDQGGGDEPVVQNSNSTEKATTAGSASVTNRGDATESTSRKSTTSTTVTTKTTAPSKAPIKNTVTKVPGGFNYISYSAINGIAPSINTARLYTWCAKKDFISIKGDLQITEDGKLIMCHDDGFTLDENGKITVYNKENATAIRTMTEEECLKLRHAKTDSPICTFEEYIRICKQYKKIAYVTIRDKYMDEIIPAILRTLEKYQMTDRCIVNSFTYASLKAVRDAAPTMMLSYVQPYKTKVTKEDVDEAVALGNCLVCGFNFSAGASVDVVAERIDKEVIAYAKSKGVPIYEAQVHSNELAKALKEYGISGVQIMVAPN